MFDTLTERLDGTFKKLRSRGKLHPKQVDNALSDMRTALLEADVAVEVADDFLSRVRARALSEEVMKSLTPGQQVVKVVNEELTVTLGGEHRPFELGGARPAVILMAGVQGSGKTTACAKLAKQLKGKGRRPLLIAADLERPAAIEQLRTLGREIGVPVWSEGKDPVKVAKQGLKEADRQGADVVIIDTAGRLHVDPDMMRQARKIKDVARPHHVLMAADAMTGQDAVVQARAFMREVDTTGFVLTKLDGDARGGAALSLRVATGQRIRFAGVGERPQDLEVFQAERTASRILGMGDVLTLIERAEQTVDKQAAVEIEKRMRAGQVSFDDFLTQIRQLRSMGSLESVLEMLPGGGALKAQVDGVQTEREVKKMEAIIQSMTARERAHPELIDGARKRRIARGSGTQPADVNRVLKARDAMQKLAKQMGKASNRQGGFAGLARLFQQGGGNW